VSLRDNSLFPIAPFRSIFVAGMISALVSALSGCERQFWTWDSSDLSKPILPRESLASPAVVALEYGLHQGPRRDWYGYPFPVKPSQRDQIMANPMPGSPGYANQPPGQSSGGMSVLKVVLIVMLVLGLGCVCCVGVSYWLFNQGMTVVATDAAAKASQYDVVKDRLGELEGADLSVNSMGTIQALQELGEECIMFDADGPLGKGQLVFRTAKGGGSGQSIGDLIQVRIDGEVISIE
jgi:hypothetical protein